MRPSSAPSGKGWMSLPWETSCSVGCQGLSEEIPLRHAGGSRRLPLPPSTVGRAKGSAHELSDGADVESPWIQHQRRARTPHQAPPTTAPPAPHRLVPMKSQKTAPVQEQGGAPTHVRSEVPSAVAAGSACERAWGTRMSARRGRSPQRMVGCEFFAVSDAWEITPRRAIPDQPSFGGCTKTHPFQRRTGPQSARRATHRHRTDAKRGKDQMERSGGGLHHGGVALEDEVVRRRQHVTCKSDLSL